jgi:hypothetical protein
MPSASDRGVRLRGQGSGHGCSPGRVENDAVDIQRHKVFLIPHGLYVSVRWLTVSHRVWVRGHAQDYILEYFRLLTDRRKQEHMQHLDRITAHAYHYYHAPPHPNEIAAAQVALKRGIDEDWQASVQRYPEVLEYFFSLVELTLPDDSEAAVRDPPLSAMSGSRKVGRRAAPATIASGGFPERDVLPRGRTPPPQPERRTPAPRARAFRPPPPPPPTYFTGQHY